MICGGGAVAIGLFSTVPSHRGNLYRCPKGVLHMRNRGNLSIGRGKPPPYNSNPSMHERQKASVEGESNPPSLKTFCPQVAHAREADVKGATQACV
jgi:hypothetical protein